MIESATPQIAQLTAARGVLAKGWPTLRIAACPAHTKTRTSRHSTPASRLMFSLNIIAARLSSLLGQYLTQLFLNLRNLKEYCGINANQFACKGDDGMPTDKSL